MSQVLVPFGTHHWSQLSLRNRNKRGTRDRRNSTRLLQSPCVVRGLLVAPRGQFSGRSLCHSGLTQVPFPKINWPTKWNDGVVLTVERWCCTDSGTVVLYWQWNGGVVLTVERWCCTESRTMGLYWQKCKYYVKCNESPEIFGGGMWCTTMMQIVKPAETNWYYVILSKGKQWRTCVKDRANWYTENYAVSAWIFSLIKT